MIKERSKPAPEQAEKRQNVTLSLPEPLLRRFRVYAAEHNESMTSLMTQAIQQLVEGEQETERERLKRRMIRRMENARNLGTNGEIDWTRDELYDRMKDR